MKEIWRNSGGPPKKKRSVELHSVLEFSASKVAPELTAVSAGVYGKCVQEGNILFNDALNTFHLRLYGVGHTVNDHSNSESRNPLPPYGLHFPISSKGPFICTIL